MLFVDPYRRFAAICAGMASIKLESMLLPTSYIFNFRLKTLTTLECHKSATKMEVTLRPIGIGGCPAHVENIPSEVTHGCIAGLPIIERKLSLRIFSLYVRILKKKYGQVARRVHA
jgi:hypothetical protein